MSKPKITYWFGAGASYQSVPLQKELSIEMRNFSTQIEEHIKFLKNDYPNREYVETLEHFNSKFRELIENSKALGTVDTLARKYWLTRKDRDLNFLRLCVDVFITWWQHANKLAYAKDEKYSELDSRYIGLLSVLMDRNSQGFAALEDDVNFLSYNYDLQLETALCDMLSLYIEDSHKYENLLSNYDFTRSQGFSKKRIVHLNGHSSFQFDQVGRTFPLFQNDQLKDSTMFYARLAQLMDKQSGHSKVANDILYAWEMDQGKMERVKELISKTDYLVIIGYSFPSFNRKIDRQILSLINENCKVIYQDNFPQKEAFESILPHDAINRIEYKNEVEQFFIPPEFF